MIIIIFFFRSEAEREADELEAEQGVEDDDEEQIGDIPSYADVLTEIQTCPNIEISQARADGVLAVLMDFKWVKEIIINIYLAKQNTIFRYVIHIAISWNLTHSFKLKITSEEQRWLCQRFFKVKMLLGCIPN